MTIREDIETYFGDAITALEENLQAMGINDAEYDSTTGIMALIAQILDIEPAVGGIPIVTSITLNASSVSTSVGSSIVLSGKVKADYDDTSVSNVDMIGYLKGASVQLYNGNTLLATVITDQDGNYSYTWTPSSAGSATIKAIFDGTDDYDNCVSSTVNVTVMSVATINLTVDKSILSYEDNEYAVLTATCLDGSNNPVQGATVTFEIVGGSVIGTGTTGSDGKCNVSYSSKGTGILYIQAKDNNNILSTQVSIDDRAWYDDGIETSYSTQWNYNNLTVTRSSTSTKLNPSTNTNGSARSTVNLGNNFELYFDANFIGIVQFGFFTTTASEQIRVYDNDVNDRTWYSYYIKVENGEFTFFKKSQGQYIPFTPTEQVNTLVNKDNYHLLFYMSNSSRSVYLKNIKAYFD